MRVPAAWVLLSAVGAQMLGGLIRVFGVDTGITGASSVSQNFYEYGATFFFNPVLVGMLAVAALLVVTAPRKSGANFPVVLISMILAAVSALLALTTLVMAFVWGADTNQVAAAGFSSVFAHGGQLAFAVIVGVFLLQVLGDRSLVPRAEPPQQMNPAMGQPGAPQTFPPQTGAQQPFGQQPAPATGAQQGFAGQQEWVGQSFGDPAQQGYADPAQQWPQQDPWAQYQQSGAQQSYQQGYADPNEQTYVDPGQGGYGQQWPQQAPWAQYQQSGGQQGFQAGYSPTGGQQGYAGQQDPWAQYQQSGAQQSYQQGYADPNEQTYVDPGQGGYGQQWPQQDPWAQYQQSGVQYQQSGGQQGFQYGYEPSGGQQAYGQDWQSANPPYAGSPAQSESGGYAAQGNPTATTGGQPVYDPSQYPPQNPADVGNGTSQHGWQTGQYENGSENRAETPLDQFFGPEEQHPADNPQYRDQGHGGQ
ncbi:mediator complex subunit 15 domain-containing protein [Haloactinospora alba]|nr:hypothetical protein [Haloactinospora alba]